jgi:hypothetical protein
MGKHSGEADYDRVCAAELMAKAQAAQSKAVRQAYLNMAMNWVQDALSRQKAQGDGPGPDPHPVPPDSPKKN